MGNTSSIPAFFILSLVPKSAPNLLAPLCGAAINQSLTKTEILSSPAIRPVPGKRHSIPPKDYGFYELRSRCRVYRDWEAGTRSPILLPDPLMKGSRGSQNCQHIVQLHQADILFG